MPHKVFLETYPLYRRFGLSLPSTLDRVETPALNGFCPKCNSVQTFRQTNSLWELYDYRNHDSKGAVVRAEYSCVSCIEFLWTFFLRISDDGKSITKIGQWPAWTIEIDANLAAMLGSHASTYQSGLICESQSYGIGAFAYYRRIVEEIIDHLLDEIADLIPETDRAAYAKALAQAKATIVAKDKIALVKDLLPSILRPDGMNPLALLHSTLSDGIHGRSDEECLNDAQHIREGLVFLVNQVLQSKESAKSFTASMQRLLDRKARTGAQKPDSAV